MINKRIDNLRSHILNRYVLCLRSIALDKDLQDRLRWTDNNKIIGQIAYSIQNIVDFSDDSYILFEDDTHYENYILQALADHTEYLEDTILPALERTRLDTNWFVQYQEELVEIKNVLDELNVV